MTVCGSISFPKIQTGEGEGAAFKVAANGNKSLLYLPHWASASAVLWRPSPPLRAARRVPPSARLGSAAAAAAAARPWRQRVAEPHHPPLSASITPRRDTVPDNNKTPLLTRRNIFIFSRPPRNGLCNRGTMAVSSPNSVAPPSCQTRGFRCTVWKKRSWMRRALNF